MYDEDELPALGWVPTGGRGSLPFALIHGESLVAAASWALGEAGVQLVDASVEPAMVVESGRSLVLHDPLCPLTPVEFLEAAVARSSETQRVVVGYRPVTDTIKERRGEVLGDTVDRSHLRWVTSPVVLPGDLLTEELLDLAGIDHLDFAVLIAELSTRLPLDWLEAPALGGRVQAEPDLLVLEALSRSAQARSALAGAGEGVRLPGQGPRETSP